MSKPIATALCVVAVAGFAPTGCKGDKGISAARKRQLQECLMTLEAVANAPPEDRVRLLAKGCPHACPRGFDAYADVPPEQRMELMSKACDLVCAKAGEPTGTKPTLQWLAEACGYDYHGLRPGQEVFMSLDWFVVQRTGAWIAEARSRLGSGDHDLAGLLDQAMATVGFPLPVPRTVQGRYELPRAESAAPVRSRVFAVVGADQITAGALPFAALTAEGARIVDAPGTPFPGAVVALATVGATIAELDKATAPPVSRIPIREEVVDAEANPEAARRMKLQKEAQSTGILRALQEKTALEGSHEPLLSSKPPVRADAPLVFADAGLSAERVLAAVMALGEQGCRLAVVDEQRGDVAAHRVGLWAGDRGRPLSVVVLDGTRVLVSASSAERREYPKRDGKHDWKTVADGVRALQAGVRSRLVIAAGGAATADELVALLDVAAAAGYAEAKVVSATDAAALLEPAPSGGPGEDRAPAARVEPGRVEAHGELDKGLVHRIIRHRTPDFRHCFEKGLVAERGLEIEVVVQFEIAPSGSVRAVKAEGGSEGVRECVAGLFGSLIFPRPEGGGVVQVRYPFKFSVPDE